MLIYKKLNVLNAKKLENGGYWIFRLMHQYGEKEEELLIMKDSNQRQRNLGF
jgi:hypothetical protein